MTLKKKELQQFIYLTYTRSCGRDSTPFKRDLLSYASAAVSEKDIILDLSTCSFLTSAEIGVLAGLVSNFKGTTRCLRIIANKELFKTLVSINLHKLEHLAIYEDKNNFITQVKQSGEGSMEDASAEE